MDEDGEFDMMSSFLLQRPKTAKIDSKNVFLCGTEIGHSSMQGYRPHMEDSFIIEPMPILSDHILVAIFDGHAGSGCSEFASLRMVDMIGETSYWQDYCNLEPSERANATEILSAAMVQAYVDLDDEFRDGDFNDGSGCTAVCALITPTHVIVANVGDSRCVIGTSDGKTISLTEDHKPRIREERRRIAAAGGFVFMDRVNGELAMSRALGDYQYKRNISLGKDKQMVICFPDIAVHTRTESDGVIILACDGVWDMMSNGDAVGFLLDVVLPNEKSSTALDLANALIEISLTEGSTDNISAIVVKLDGATVDASSAAAAGAGAVPLLAAMNDDSIGDGEEEDDEENKEEEDSSDPENDGDDDQEEAEKDDAVHVTSSTGKKSSSQGHTPSKTKPPPSSQKKGGKSDDVVVNSNAKAKKRKI